MELFQAIFLGALQGLTEFLPVSSSGHLVIAQALIPGFSQPGVLFDVILHLGTTLAVLWYFRKKILSLSLNYIFLLALGTLPAAILGVVFQSELEALFSSVRLVGITLLITGGMNWMIDKIPNSKSSTSRLNPLNALFIGVFQAIAIIPAISRSGSTIFAGVLRGINKEEAATFSFLLSIPAILGSVVLELITHRSTNSLDISVYLVGIFVSFVVGYLSIGVLMRFLVEKKFKVFAIYCWIVGLTTIILTL
ncbi:MAG: undecaprenyl-diphosphate phosphatase [bacterium]|nr:undecaprenyl-diphosphate phosphatase [bacterium]